LVHQNIHPPSFRVSLKQIPLPKNKCKPRLDTLEVVKIEVKTTQQTEIHLFISGWYAAKMDLNQKGRYQLSIETTKRDFCPRLGSLKPLTQIAGCLPCSVGNSMAKISASRPGGSIAAGGAVPVVPPWVVGGAGAAGAGSRLNLHNGKFGLNHYSTKHT
jgi:hypothetical protein